MSAFKLCGFDVGLDQRFFLIAGPCVIESEQSGLIISARTPNEELPEMMELPSSIHPWFFGVQFHPEFTSTPRDGHPLFSAFISAALEHQKAAEKQAA